MKRFIPIILVITLLLSACSAGKNDTAQTALPDSKPAAQSSQTADKPAAANAGKAEQNGTAETDWLALYAPVFDSYKVLFTVVNAYRQGSESPVDLTGSDYDLANNLSLYLESLAKPGFCLEDLDGNGVPELIVGLMTDDYFYSRIIAGLFTIEDGAPETVFTSYTRSRYCLSSDGGFIYEGSGGAAYSDYYSCTLSGSSLNINYGAYSDGESGFFYVENGDRENAAKTESISQEQFAEYYNKLDSMIIDPPEYTMIDINQ